MWGGGYVLGGEPGGNIIINDGHHTAADATYAAIVLSGMLVRNRGVGLKEIATPLRKRAQVTDSRKLPAPLTPDQKTTLKNKIRDKQAELSADSRILFWDSSTEPKAFRVMVEGGYENTLKEVTAMADAIWQLVEQVSSQMG